jgi:hypothetical protein
MSAITPRQVYCFVGPRSELQPKRRSCAGAGRAERDQQRRCDNVPGLVSKRAIAELAGHSTFAISIRWRRAVRRLYGKNQGWQLGTYSVMILSARAGVARSDGAHDVLFR